MCVEPPPPPPPPILPPIPPPQSHTYGPSRRRRANRERILAIDARSARALFVRGRTDEWGLMREVAESASVAPAAMR